MKYICVLLTFIFSYTYGQGLIINYGKKTFYEAEIVLENGEVKKGFIKDFTMPNTFEFNISYKNLDYFESTVYKNLGANNNTFKFKPTMDGDIEKINGSNVSEITIIDKETFNYKTFKKLDVKRISNELKIIDARDDLFLPLIKKGEYNIYGILMKQKQGNQELYSGLYIVYENPRTNFAVSPVDVGFSGVRNISMYCDKIDVGISELLKDCPLALKEIKDQINKSRDIDYIKKESIKASKNYIKFIKDVKKKVKSYPRKDRKRVESDLWADYYIHFYIKNIDEINNSCDFE